MAESAASPQRRSRKAADTPVITAATRPDWSFELAGLSGGARLIAGCDEVGRGSWAGPLVAAAVAFAPELILASNEADKADQGCLDALAELEGVRDSKMLLPAQREAFNVCVRRRVLAAGVGIVSSGLCDAIGIAAANRLAMVRAVRGLGFTPDLLLLDAFKLPLLRVPQLAIIKGDARCMTIAAASIVAKVARDTMMAGYDAEWPGYGFGKHKGYGTPEHAAALLREGPTPLHRRCFAPVRAMLAQR